MNARQRSELDRALARADAEGVVVMGKGIRKLDGAPVYGVTSSRDPNRWYLVAVLGDHLVCPCRARGVCKHRAVVHRRLRAERATHLALTARPTHIVTSSADERATAPLHRSNAPFSLFKVS